MNHCDLKKSVRYVKGIGPKRAEILARMGVDTIYDLFHYFPRSYQDRSSFVSIPEAVLGEYVTVKGVVVAKGVRPTRSIKIFELVLDDGHARVWCLFFNQPYLDSTFQIDQEIIVSGKIELYKKRFQLKSPEYEIIKDDDGTVHAGRIVPVYPLSEGLSQRVLRTAMKTLVDDYAKLLSENIPESLIAKHSLVSREISFQNIHFPETGELCELSRKRIVYEEFYLFESEIAQRLQRRKLSANAFVIRDGKKCAKEFQKVLPFVLTGSQKNVIDEVVADCAGKTPMYRILQGDVGSGKTMVAACGLYCAAQNGFQGVLMVPTEILAEQHFKTLQPLFDTYKICIALLTGSTSKKEKISIYEALKNGKINILIGTHAVLNDEVDFLNLGFVVIDEQHKFGVEQRAYISAQKRKPHVLVMSATPIPRTLGLALFADIDVSTLSELPHGDRNVKTYWITARKEREVYDFVKKKIDNGEQAYVVYPLVEESMKMDLKAATEEFKHLQKDVFKDYSLALVHGRIDKKEKNRIMDDFRKGSIQLIVATTVIEVGIDNPNASIIIIQHAERFGLSQLHQMRGRVGRGKKESYCFLFGEPTTDTGKKRLRLMTKTNDGFKIAEQDLLLRGPGEFLGTRQSGLPQFKLADLVFDSKILQMAKEDAFRLEGAP